MVYVEFNYLKFVGSAFQNYSRLSHALLPLRPVYAITVKFPTDPEPACGGIP